MMRYAREMWMVLVAVLMVVVVSGCESSSLKDDSPASIEQVKQQVAQGTVILVMGKHGCKSCQQMEPIIAETASATGVKLVKQFPDKNMADAFNIGSFPTIIVYSDGAECDRWVGYRSVGELTEMVERCKNKQSN